MKKLGLSNKQRLRHREEFSNVYNERTRAGDRFLLIYGKPNEFGVTRIGLSVSRKLGGAVIRSRLKRLIREAFRISQHEIPEGFDLIIIPRSAEEASLNDYCASLKKLARKIERQFRRKS